MTDTGSPRFSALHGTTTAVVPADGTPVTLQPASVHQGTTIWPERIAPREFLYLGDYVATYFAYHRAAQDGYVPVIVSVEAPAASLHPDPAWLYAMREATLAAGMLWPPPPPVSITDYKESWEVCGRVACDSPAEVISRWVCHTSLDCLGHVLVDSGMARFVKEWVDVDTWWPDQAQRYKARRPALDPRVYDDPRAEVGRLIVATCFTEVRAVP